MRTSSSGSRLLRPASLALAVALAFAGGVTFANPTGPTVVNGQVTVNPAGNLLNVTNSPNAIIDWQAFSIGAGEITRLTQQSAASAVLNRVVGSGGTIDPSVILGALQSNGRVFLINPSGIVFGAGAQIDRLASEKDLGSRRQGDHPDPRTADRTRGSAFSLTLPSTRTRTTSGRSISISAPLAR